MNIHMAELWMIILFVYKRKWRIINNTHCPNPSGATNAHFKLSIIPKPSSKPCSSNMGFV
jgi:hypothetical protein